MINAKRGRSILLGLALATVVALTIVWSVPVSAQQAGTTLTAYKTATGHLALGSTWEISKTVTPDTWDLFAPYPTPSVSGTSQYVVTVAKHAASGESYVDGQICVTNGGSVATENLQIVDGVQYKPGPGKFQDYASSLVDLSAKPVLAPGESYCYPYSVAFTPVAGATYRNVAHITITNHSGWLPGGNNCPGPALCPFGPDPKADFNLPDSPELVAANGTITVSDTNGDSWTFSDSGSVTYTETFVCDANQPPSLTHTNVATILETGQSASATVQVYCVFDNDGYD